MIQPTVGRVVHYHPAGMDPDPSLAAYTDQPLCAFIAYVWNERLVNLGVLDSNGELHSKTSVVLVQPEDDQQDGPSSHSYATWMPYQVKKSFGSESGEKAAGKEEV